MNINGYEIKIGNVYESKHASLVQVEIIKDNSKKHYLIDIEKRRIIKK
ncbi:hypothetical protein J4463_02045 [Candidatus Pacearchaeota archaeon]|nr:hypothetical protein [Candidatus Pacearchaeota archaeon]